MCQVHHPLPQRLVVLRDLAYRLHHCCQRRLARLADRQGLVVGAEVNGRSAQFDCPCVLPEKCYVGITACEGENYFYRFSIR